MQVLTAEYKGQSIRYVFVSLNGILFNASDICRILNIEARFLGLIVQSASINMTGIIKAALTDGRNEMELVEWLEANFLSYEIETPTELCCDDDWK